VEKAKQIQNIQINAATTNPKITQKQNDEITAKYFLKIL
jgi:hypothetical protein